MHIYAMLLNTLLSSHQSFLNDRDPPEDLKCQELEHSANTKISAFIYLM